MTAPSIMVRIPADLVPKLDRLARIMRARTGFAPDAECEITRAFVHHLALRRGVAALGGES